MRALAARRGFLVFAAVMVLLAVGVGVMNYFEAEESWLIQQRGRAWAVALPIIPAAIIAAGLGVNLRSRLLGGSLIFIGALSLGTMFWWTIIAPILAGLTLAFWFIAFRNEGATSS